MVAQVCRLLSKQNARWKLAPDERAFPFDHFGGGPVRSCRNEQMIKQTTAMQMQESATLKAGHGCAKGTWRSKRRKSITCPWTRRSVRLPRMPASNNPSAIFLHESTGARRSNMATTT